MEQTPSKTFPSNGASLIGYSNDNDDSVYSELSSLKKKKYTASRRLSISLCRTIVSFTMTFAFISGFIILSCFEFGIVKAITIGFHQDKQKEINLLNSDISTQQYSDIKRDQKDSLVGQFYNRYPNLKKTKHYSFKIKMMDDYPILQKNDTVQLLLIHSPSNINETAMYTMTDSELKILTTFIKTSVHCPLHVGREAYDRCPRAIILNPYVYTCCAMSSLEFINLHVYSMELDLEYTKRFVDALEELK